MIIENQFVNVKWQANNTKHFKEKGYEYTSFNDTFKVKVKDLSKSSNVMVKVECDYCQKIFDISYNNYNRLMEKSYTKKYACKDCSPLKVKETNTLLYGVENALQRKEIKEKRKNTCIKKYGVDNPSKAKEVKEKIIQTNLKKYGVRYGLSDDSIKEKIRNTCLEKYGVEYISQVEEIKQKIRQTNFKKYGYENNLCHPEERKKALIKSRETLYKNGKTMCSKQQKHLHNLLGGELNYNVYIYSLDIAFPQEKLYIEYDGSGHDLSVKLGSITEIEFEKKSENRQNYLNDKGWKLIRIISNKDYLPDDNSIINIINIAKNKLNNYDYCKIHIDNETIETNNNIEKIKFNNLRRL